MDHRGRKQTPIDGLEQGLSPYCRQPRIQSVDPSKSGEAFKKVSRGSVRITGRGIPRRVSSEGVEVAD